jgi:hypothetical protein
MRSGLIRLFSTFYFAGILGVSVQAAPKNLSDYHLVIGSYLSTLPEGSIVQGSVEFGGLQPDYLVDFQNPEFAGLRQYIETVKASHGTSELKKIALVNNAVSTLLERKLYTDKSNYLLAQMYKEDGKDIPLSEYAYHRTGVCREHALILQKSLSELGIENHFVYAKIERETSDHQKIVEDHAFNTIVYQGKEWIVDAYYSGFNGFSFKDLIDGKEKPEHLNGIPEYQGQRRILNINKYPIVWIPKFLKCERVLLGAS